MSSMRSSLARLSNRRLLCIRAVTTRYSLSVTPHVSTDRQLTNHPRCTQESISLPSLFWRIHFSTDPNARSKILERNIKKARALLDERIHPRGSYTASHGTKAKQVLDYFKKVKTTDSESMSLSIALIERLVAERATSNDGVQSKWICEPRYFTPLLNLWKEATKQGKAVISPRDLVKKLQTMSRMLPEFRYNIVTVNIIMDVLIKEAPTKKAPFVAEELLNFVRKEATEMKSMELRPNVYVYNNVMRAWAVSGLPEAPARLDALVQTMREEGIVFDEVTYNIFLRYWAREGDVDKIEAILATMRSEGVKPSVTSLTQAIYGHAKVGNTAKAEEMLNQMTELPLKDAKESRMIGESVHSILFAYRRVVDDSTVDFLRKEKAVECAEALFEKMNNSSHLNYEDQTRITSTMTDFYARAGEHHKAEMVSERLQLDSVQLNILIKSLGKADNADKATDIVKRVLTGSQVDPTIEHFGALINVWAESSHPDTVEQAFAVLRLMNENPKCIELGIRPNTVTFNSLLKCISKSKSKEAGKWAVEVLDDMERRYKAGDNNAKPDQISFSIVIKTCLQVRDVERAETLMDSLENSDSPSDIRTYADIMNHWAKAGTPEAAERSEKILAHMKQLATTKNFSLKPDVYSYNIAMNAWSKSGHPESEERMWRLYEKMKEEDVESDFVTYTTLISFFSKSKQRQVMQRADSLLQSMEENKHSDNQPDHRHFVPLIKGWLSIGDMENATQVLMGFANARKAKPSRAIIGMVTQGWIKAGNLEQATSLITKMQELNDAQLIPEGPTNQTYNSLLAAWIESNHPDRARNIDKLVERLATL